CQGHNDGESDGERDDDVGQHGVGPMQRVHDRFDDLQDGERGDAVPDQCAEDAPALELPQHRHGVHDAHPRVDPSTWVATDPRLELLRSIWFGVGLEPLNGFLIHEIQRGAALSRGGPPPRPGCRPVPNRKIASYIQVMSTESKRGEGAAEELGGTIKKVAGKVLGNEQMEAEGNAKELKGEAKQDAAKAA